MRSILITIIVCFLFQSKANGQDIQYNDSTVKFLGMGWVIAISDDIAFIPSSNQLKIPTIDDYFKEKNKRHC